MTLEEKLERALELLNNSLHYVQTAYYNDGEEGASELAEEISEFFIINSLDIKD